MKETDSLFIQISELIDKRISKHIGGGQSSTLQAITGVAINSDRNLNQVVNELSKLFITKSEFSDIDGRIDDLALSIQYMVDEVIVDGLVVSAEDPPSSNVTITAGYGGKRGRPCRLDTVKTIEVPLDDFSSIFYITLQSYGQVNVRRSRVDDELTLAKIVVPKPGTTSAIIDDKDDSYDAYIVSAKDSYFDGDTVFDEDSKAVLRNAIGDILADNLIGNIKLSENLKIINTQGTLELDSKELLIKDAASNVLSRFDKDGIYIFDAQGFEKAHFTGDDARIGNIIIKPESLESQNFVSGILGSGFRLTDKGNAEFKDVLVRGKISSSIFEYNSVTATAGNILVSHDADKLAEDMTTTSTSLVTDGDVLFEAGDIIWLKEGNNQEYMTIASVTNSSNYTVTRESGGTAIAWQSGVALVNLGQSGDGGIYLTASESDAPYLSIFTHDGSPWNGLSTKLRLGNLNGFLGYSSDLYGIAIGETNKYLKYDSTNGLRVRGNIDADSGNLGTMTVDGALTIGTDGTIGSGQTAYDTGTGFWLEYNSGTPRFSIGDGSTNSLTWNGSALSVAGAIDANSGTLGSLTVDGSLSIEASGSIGSGQSAYNTGTGFWFEYNSGTPRFSIGDSSTNSLTWDGSALSIAGAIDANSGTLGTLTVDGAISVGASGTIGSGQSAYNTGTGFWLEYNSDTPRFSIGDGSNYLLWTGTALQVAGLTTFGAIDISTGGYIKSGQTAYDTGTGYWIEYNAGTPRFSLGNAAGNKLTWDGSNLNITGTIICGASSSYAGDSIATTYTAAKCIDANADQTSINTAAAITGQGDLATKNEAAANVLNMTNAPAEAGATADQTATEIRTGTGWSHASDVTKIDGGDIYTGTVTADKITAGTFVGGSFIVGAGGDIRSSDYSAGTTGFLLHPTTGLEINTGILKSNLQLYTVGDALEIYSDSTISVGFTVYTKVKEFTLARAGTLRISFTFAGSTGGSASNYTYARIYKNGAAVGTERSLIRDTAYTTYSQDISGFAIGDTVQLYIKDKEGGYGGPAKNFRLYCTYPTVTHTTYEL